MPLTNEEFQKVMVEITEQIQQLITQLTNIIGKYAQSTKPALTLQTVQNSFPEELKGLLSFTEEGGFVKVKPRQFLGSERFAQIADIVKGLGGEYVSAGKESHFRVPTA